MSTTRTPPGFIWHYAPTDPPPRYRTDARRVECAADLPPRLFMGFRDDESFWKRGSLLKRRTNFGISYRNEGEVVGELRYEDGSLSFREQWKGIGGPPAMGPGPDLRRLAQMNYSHPFWDGWFAEHLTLLGNFAYAAAEGAPSMAGFPDGCMVDVLFPVSSQRLPELNDFYQGLKAEIGYSPSVSAYSQLMVASVNWILTREPTTEELVDARQLLWRESITYLHLPQSPFPKLQSAGEGDQKGWAITDHRYAYIHTCDTVLRDVVPICERLVDAGFIAPYRSESKYSKLLDPLSLPVLAEHESPVDAASGRNLAVLGSGAYRALVCPSAQSMETIHFWSDDGKMRMTYDKPAVRFLEEVASLRSPATPALLLKWRRDAIDAAAIADEKMRWFYSKIAEVERGYWPDAAGR